MRSLLLALIFLPLAATGADMQPGHVYKYQTRAHEAGSTFVLIKVDDIKGSKVASISVSGLKFKSPKAPGGFADSVGHMPISLDALMASKPEDTGTVIKVEWPNDGYDLWKEALDGGKAGFWKASIKDCIDAMESALNQ